MNKQIDSSVIAAAFDSIYKFNDVAKQFEGNLEEGIDLQLSLVFEEVSEAIVGFESNSEEGLLDGAVDSFVTVVGLLQKLQTVGFDVERALLKVTDNNLSKYVEVLPASIKLPKGQKSEWNSKYGVHVITDENGKIRKPPNFMPVDLWDCVPHSFFVLEGEV